MFVCVWVVCVCVRVCVCVCVCVCVTQSLHMHKISWVCQSVGVIVTMQNMQHRNSYHFKIYFGLNEQLNK